ncbi:MAG TPA: arginine--tRNA ligase [Thermoanaerobaculia bacterium]|nr:arginine--tRNA ligase [Thermoanaerobaculia bacterium]
MLRELKRDLQARISALLRARFSIEHDAVMEVPPRRELGDLASPVALHLARELKRKPRDIAEALAGELELPALVERLSVEGPGYLNFFLDRRTAAAHLLDAEPIAALDPPALDGKAAGKVIVEHTNINPNKAAHIGHLRNAVLGDILVRSYRALGYLTEVQNYIDDTGVQLADVVVGFCDLRGETAAEVAAHPDPFDYLCWDLYSEVGRWYEQDSARLERRRATLHELESGEGDRAALGRLVARRIVGRHLCTMARLGVGYDLLTRESEILRLEFFRTAFEKLHERGAIRLEAEGKNRGCWVMPLSESEEFQGLEDPDKVIVRSDGTVTYVGKDIAYQLWKFALLGRDFEYRRFEGWPALWETGPAEDAEVGGGPGGGGPPPFGGGSLVVNVIDARQSYLQKIVRAGLEALGHEDEARRSVHFAYEMVSLSPQTARVLGYLGEESEDQRLEMSGRKGIGVKADDLLDRLEAKSREEIVKRNRDLEGEELDRLARQIATAAVRYFMVRATTTRVIAFDLDEALSFEGDSGPYLQYSLVRAKNILRRLDEAGLAIAPDPDLVRAADPARWSDDLWDLVFTGAQAEQVVAKAAETLELSLIARCAVDLAQKFHAVYHKHPILQEEDVELRAVRLVALHVFRRSLRAICELIGVEEPDRM